MAMMAVWAAVLITYGVSTGIAMVAYMLDDGLLNCCALTSDSGEPGSNVVLQLDMAPNSVDDMYNGCNDEMKSKVQNGYLQNEKNNDKKFKEAWVEAEEIYNTKWLKSTMGKEHFMAISVYTSGAGNIHLDFNNAVRTQKSEYKTTFGYHTLHFFLTDALQTLVHEEKRCFTGYRGVDKYFSQDVLNKEIRLGSFTSTTMLGYRKAKTYGDKSCFEIVTCLGTDISLYSKFEDAEAEVLIPPYEVFKVIEIKKRSVQKDLPCEVVYKLKSTERARSNLNCALF